MPTIRQRVEHRRISRVYFTASEVTRLLTQAACNMVTADPDTALVEINITQETKGSPAYSVDRWTASVTVTEGQPGDSGDLPEKKVEL